MTAKKQNKIHAPAPIYFVGALTLFAVLIFSYIYFLSASVVHVVMRQEANQEIAMLQSEISKLEADLIARQHAISNEIAALDGFIESTEKTFIDRSRDSLVLGTIAE